MRRLIAPAGVAMSLALAASALGQHRDPEHAARLFDQARAAMTSDDYDGAYETLLESQRLDPSLGTLLNLAICEEQIGKLADAHAHIQQVLAQLSTDDPRRPLAKQHAASIDARVPRLILRLASNAPGGTLVVLDGLAVAAEAIGTPTPVDPGRHTVVVSAPQRERRSITVVIEERERKELTVAPGEAEQRAGKTPPREKNPGNTTAYVLLGIGTVGIGVAGATGLVLRSKQQTAHDHCDAEKRCDQVGLDAASSGKRLVPIYTGAFVVGAAGLATGAYMLLTGGEADSDPRLDAGFGPTEAVVRWRGRF